MIRYLFNKEIIISNSLQIKNFSPKEQIGVNELTADNKSAEEFTVSIAAERGIRLFSMNRLLPD